MGHRRAPGVEHGGEADAGAEVLRIGCDRRHRLCRGAEQEVVDGGFVLESHSPDLGGQGEDDVEVSDRQEVGLSLGQPVARRRALAPRTVPVAAGVVGDPQMAAVVAALDMAAECGGATMLDRRHDLQLRQTYVPGAAHPERRPGDAQDVGDLDRGAHRLSRAKPPLGEPGPAGRAG